VESNRPDNQQDVWAQNMGHGNGKPDIKMNIVRIPLSAIGGYLKKLFGGKS
jgi:hypothetical protein